MKEFKINIQDREIIILQDDDGFFIKPEIVVELEKQGTATKPAHEPICMARKPLAEKTVAENVLKWGTGGINIDESRVGTEEITTNAKVKGESFTSVGNSQGFNGCKESTHIGRFPANLIHDNSEEVRECFPDSNATNRNNMATRKDDSTSYGGKSGQQFTRKKFGDSGNASRFFKSIIYQAKASKSERNKGCEGNKFNSLEIVLNISSASQIIWNEKLTIQEEKEVKHLMDMDTSLKKVIDEFGIQRKNDLDLNIISFGKLILEKYLKDTKYITEMEISSITSQQILNLLHHYTINENIQDVFLKMMDGGNLVVSVENSNTLIITTNEHLGLVLGVSPVVLQVQFKINEKEFKCDHPTVKPLKLMEYLIRMVTPRGGVVLDPFAGSGSTLVAAKANGFGYVGVELTEEYVPIIEARLKSVDKEKVVVGLGKWL